MSKNDAPRRRLLDRDAGAPTLLGAGSRFEGRLETQGAAIVAGTVIGDGEIRGALSIATGAHWQGDVHAQVAVIAGTLTGNLHVDDKLEIGKGAVIRGNVRAKQLAIANGAIVDGEIQVTGDQPVVRFEEKRESRLVE